MILRGYKHDMIPKGTVANIVLPDGNRKTLCAAEDMICAM